MLSKYTIVSFINEKLLNSINKKRKPKFFRLLLSYVAIFSICMDAKLFGMRRIYQFSPYRQDATDRSKISSDQKRFFIALSLYPLSFFANTPFKPIPPFIFANTPFKN